MKRFVKACLILAMVFFLLGIAGCTVGVGLAGSRAELIDQIQQESIVANLEKGLGHILGRYYERGAEVVRHQMNKANIKWHEWNEYTEEETKTYQFNPDEIKSMAIDVTASDIIYEEGRDEIEVVVRSKNRKVEVEKQEESISIKEESTLHNHFDSNIIQIKAPADMIWNKIDVRSSSGDMTVKNAISAGNICYNGDSGDVHFEEQIEVSDKLDLTIGAGDCDLSAVNAKSMHVDLMAGNCNGNGKITGNVSFESRAGDVRLLQGVDGDLKVENQAGDVEVNLTGKEEDYNYKVHSAVSSVKINGRSYGDDWADEYEKDNGAEHMIDIDCSAGDVDIYFK